jgi:ElaB/YqjD/DUF883 family membrane-anchored ribosome-binding protein
MPASPPTNTPLAEALGLPLTAMSSKYIPLREPALNTASLSTTTVLKHAANFIVGLTLVKAVMADLGAELQRDLSGLGSQTRTLVRRSPYGAAGTAAAMGVVAGILLAKRHPNRP